MAGCRLVVILDFFDVAQFEIGIDVRILVADSVRGEREGDADLFHPLQKVRARDEPGRGASLPHHLFDEIFGPSLEKQPDQCSQNDEPDDSYGGEHEGASCVVLRVTKKSYANSDETSCVLLRPIAIRSMMTIQIGQKRGVFMK